MHGFKLQLGSEEIQEKLNLYGSSQFIQTMLNEEDVNERFLAELIATYTIQKGK